MYKKIICLALLLLFVLPFPNNVYAQNEPTVILNGNVLTFDVQPVIVEGRLLVPLSGIFSALGATVSWDAATQTINASQGNTTLMLVIGSQKALINGTEVYFDVPALIMNSRTMVPLSFVAMSLNCQVGYDAASNTVTINSVYQGDVKSNTQVYESPVQADLTGTWHSSKSIFWLTQQGNQLTGNLHDTSTNLNWSLDGTISGNMVTINFHSNTESSHIVKGIFDYKDSNCLDGTMIPSWTDSYGFIARRAAAEDLTGIWHTTYSTVWIIEQENNLTGNLYDSSSKLEWNFDGTVSGNMVTINFQQKTDSSHIIKGIFDYKDGNRLEGTMIPSWTNSYNFVLQR